MDVSNKYGDSAGKIWTVLYKKGSTKEENLMKLTKLQKDEFYAAIGWLARENKICKNKNYYELGDTNLIDKIGADAGKVWDALYSFGEIDISHLAQYAKIQETDAISAIGWLAREDKIQGIKKKSKGFQTKFQLK